MQITTKKRFEFAASRRLPDGRWSGNNFSGWAGVRGPIDSATGMLINIVTLKGFLKEVLHDYDHRNLNAQLADSEPTTMNVAAAIWDDLKRRMPAAVRLSELELEEEEENAVRLAADRSHAVWRGRFSAAHRTHAPQLAPEQNRRLYGICNNPAGHGHNYAVEIAVPSIDLVPADLLAEFDHRNLSVDIPEFAGRNVVTETIAASLATRVPQADGVRVWETPDFFAEYLPAQDLYRLGRRYKFHAAHRLASLDLSPQENQILYGKCNRQDPHGHTYIALVTVQGRLDSTTETAYDLACLDEIAAKIFGELDGTYLDLEVPAFREQPSTGENIAAYIFERFAQNIPTALHSVRLWETPNNQFVAARQGE